MEPGGRILYQSVPAARAVAPGLRSKHRRRGSGDDHWVSAERRLEPANYREAAAAAFRSRLAALIAEEMAIERCNVDFPRRVLTQCPDTGASSTKCHVILPF